MMERRTVGVLLGVAGLFLWFMPWAAWEQQFMGRLIPVHQSGYHVGGLAYLLLVAMAVYAVTSWLQHHQLRIVSAVSAAAVCSLYLLNAGENAAWGLLGLVAVSVAGGWVAFTDSRSAKPSMTA